MSFNSNQERDLYFAVVAAWYAGRGGYQIDVAAKAAHDCAAAAVLEWRHRLEQRK